jgi:transposase
VPLFARCLVIPCSLSEFPAAWYTERSADWSLVPDFIRSVHGCDVHLGGFALRLNVNIWSPDLRKMTEHRLAKTVPVGRGRFSFCEGSSRREAAKRFGFPSGSWYKWVRNSGVKPWVVRRSRPVKIEQEFIFIAVMDGEERTISHIHGLLRAAGIHFTAEGEGISELCVERADVERAVTLLQAERNAGWMVSVSPFTYLKERGRI